MTEKFKWTDSRWVKKYLTTNNWQSGSELQEKYLGNKKKKKDKSVNESSELWFGSWSRSTLIWVQEGKVLFSSNAEFPTGSQMGESERKSAQSRGYILVDW